LGNFFDQALHLLVIVDRLANPLLPRLGDANLAQFASLTLNQVEGVVGFSLGAMAIWFAALAQACGQSAAQKPMAGGQLGNAGAEVALGGGESGADEGVGHILYLYNIQDQDGKQAQKHNTNLPFDRRRAKTVVESDALVD
jgi:hypothetical protein